MIGDVYNFVFYKSAKSGTVGILANYMLDVWYRAKHIAYVPDSQN